MIKGLIRTISNKLQTTSRVVVTKGEFETIYSILGDLQLYNEFDEEDKIRHDFHNVDSILDKLDIVLGYDKD